MLPEVDFRSAITDTISLEMTVDSRVILLGEDVAFAGGVFQATRGLLARHGPDRVLDTPISELALAGAAFGAAITGMRPIVEIMFGDFIGLALDSLINQAAKYWFVSNEQQSVPLVVRTAVGAGGQFGAIHSQIPASWMMGVAGLKIVAPSTPADAAALLSASVRDDNPVVFLEHKKLYNTRGPAWDGDVQRIGEARVLREGTDVVLISCMTGVRESLTAAEQLALDGIDAEVLDIRTIRPLDLGTILGSVKKTRRVIVVEEGPRTGGWASEVLASVVESGICIDWAVRETGPNLPLGFSKPLETAALPRAKSIVERVKELFVGSPKQPVHD